MKNTETEVKKIQMRMFQSSFQKICIRQNSKKDLIHHWGRLGFDYHRHGYKKTLGSKGQPGIVELYDTYGCCYRYELFFQLFILHKWFKSGSQTFQTLWQQLINFIYWIIVFTFFLFYSFLEYSIWMFYSWILYTVLLYKGRHILSIISSGIMEIKIIIKQSTFYIHTYA